MSVLILLPPSETKRSGGEPCADAGRALSFSELGAARRAVREALDATVALDDAAAARALKVGAKGAPAELARNRALDTAPVMAALDRYTGVLYDALDAGTLDADARARAGRSVAIHSALFGVVGALDPIPAYRLSHDSRLVGTTLKRVWREPIAQVLAEHRGPILDLRSEGYAGLGPLPAREDALFVRVVTVGDDGVARALNHFNKKGKGAFVRALLQAGELPSTVDGLIARATAAGWILRRTAPGELELVVPNS